MAILCALSLSAKAADGEDYTGQNTGLEVGLLIGSLLPNQVNGITEIMGLGGVRGGYRLSPEVVLEGTFSTGQGYSADYKNLAASFRFDVPIEGLVADLYLGADATYFKGGGNSGTILGGGHAGGGVMSLVGGNLWFRADMKFTVSPGTSLFVNFALLFRFPGQ